MSDDTTATPEQHADSILLEGRVVYMGAEYEKLWRALAAKSAEVEKYAQDLRDEAALNDRRTAELSALKESLRAMTIARDSYREEFKKQSSRREQAERELEKAKEQVKPFVDLIEALDALPDNLPIHDRAERLVEGMEKWFETERASSLARAEQAEAALAKIVADMESRQQSDLPSLKGPQPLMRKPSICPRCDCNIDEWGLCGCDNVQL